MDTNRGYERLKSDAAGQRVVAAILSEGEADEARKRAFRISADEVVTTLKDAVSTAATLAATTRKKLEPKQVAHA